MAEKKIIIGEENHHCNKERSKSESESRDLSLFLPVDIVISILSRLPVELLPRCRRVCKSWWEIIDSPPFLKKSQLLFLKRGWPRSKLYSLKPDVSNNTFTYSSWPIAEFGKSFDCLTSNYLGFGLFLFKNNYCVILYNPMKGELLMLPRTTSHTPTALDSISNSYGLGFDRITNQYKLVCVCEVGKWKGTHRVINLVTKVYTLGSSEWRPISDVPPCCIGKSSVAVPVLEVIHWKPLKSEGIVVSFDVRKENFKVTPLPDRLLTKYALFSWRESLAIADMSWTDHIEIWVLKDYDNKSWEKEYRISTTDHRPPLLFCGAWEDGMICTFCHGMYYYDPKTDGVTKMVRPIWTSDRLKKS